jgi:hypothetical protein
MPVLFNSAGVPEPSPEVQRRLRAIHPRLKLAFVQHAPSAWAVRMTWDENDPRYAQVQSGRLPPDRAVDTIGYLPMDATADDAPGYLARMFRQYPVDAVQSLVDRVTAFNATAPVQAAAEAAIADVLDSSNPVAAPKASRRR